MLHVVVWRSLAHGEMMTEYGPKTPLAIELDEMKYRLKGETFKEKCSRVANALKDSDGHSKRNAAVLQML